MIDLSVLDRAECDPRVEGDLAELLDELATALDADAPAVALLFRVLADEPAEIAAAHAPALLALADRLDTDTARVVRAAARSLAVYAE